MNNARSRKALVAAGVAIGGLAAVTPAVASSGTQSASAFMTRYFAAQDTALVPSTKNVGATLASLYGAGATATALRTYQAATAVGFHQWVAMHGDSYRSIHTGFTVNSLRQSGTTAVASVRTVTAMLWTPHISATHPAFTKEKAAEMAKLKREGKLAGPNDVVTSRVSTTHALTLTRVGAQWRVVRDDYVDPLNMQFAANHLSPARAPQAPAARTQTTVQPATGETRHSMSYDRASVETYADKYWSNYNTPKYLNYNSVGGDCANFVSQSISDPGGGDAPWDSKWYYNWYSTSYTGASPPDWRLAAGLHTYLLNSPEGSTYNDATEEAKGTYSATLSKDQSSMQRGDVIFYYNLDNDSSIDHTTVQVAELADGTSIVDAHNGNHYHTRYDLGYSTKTLYLDHMHSTLYYLAPST
jgi:hypothetical protein